MLSLSKKKIFSASLFFSYLLVCYNYIVIVVDQDDGTASSAMEKETETEGVATNVDHRIIFINRTQPPVTKFVGNRISTAKYR